MRPSGFIRLLRTNLEEYGANRLMFDVFLMFLVLNGLIMMIVSFLLHFICLTMNINVYIAKWHTPPTTEVCATLGLPEREVS